MSVNPRRAETTQTKDHLRVQFTTADGRMWVYAHRVVWMVANHREIPSGLEINHKDGDPTNNRPENLDLATRQENTLHAGRVLKRLGTKAQNGEMNAAAKVTESDVIRIRELWAAQTMTQRQIAEAFGLKQQAVSCIVTRKSWSHVK
jgi:predicted XRE-type DNA-binding protein